MPSESNVKQGKLFRAATTSYDIYDPAHALNAILQLTMELIQASRAALYEYDEAEVVFGPRFAQGVALSDLGRVSASGEHPVLRSVLTTHAAATTPDNRGSLGLPLAPGVVACAPCTVGGQTIGLLFAAADRTEPFPEQDLATLEVLASRAGEVLAFARQTASQSYILNKLSLLYQASHAISGPRDRQEAMKQTAAHLLKATSADFCEVHIISDGKGRLTRYRQQLGKSVQHSLVVQVSDNLPAYPVHKQVLKELRPATLSVVPPLGSARDITILQEEGFASATIFPLATRSEGLGLVRLLFTQRGRQISDQEMELAQAIINIGAVGLQDAIHFETAQSRGRPTPGSG